MKNALELFVLLVQFSTCKSDSIFHENKTANQKYVPCYRTNKYLQGLNTFDFEEIVKPTLSEICSLDFVGQTILSPFDHTSSNWDFDDVCYGESEPTNIITKLLSSNASTVILLEPSTIIGQKWTQVLGTRNNGNSKTLFISCELESWNEYFSEPLNQINETNQTMPFTFSASEWQVMWENWTYKLMFRWGFSVLFMVTSVASISSILRHRKCDQGKKNSINPIPVIVLWGNTISTFVLSLMFLCDGWWSIGNFGLNLRYCCSVLLAGQSIGCIMLVSQLWIETRCKIVSFGQSEVSTHMRNTFIAIAIAFCIVLDASSMIYLYISCNEFALQQVFGVYSVLRMFASTYCLYHSIKMSREISKMLPKLRKAHQRSLLKVSKFISQTTKWLCVSSICMWVSTILGFLMYLPQLNKLHLPRVWAFFWWLMIIARLGESITQVMICQPTPDSSKNSKRRRSSARLSFLFRDQVVTPQKSVADENGSMLSELTTCRLFTDPTS